MRLTDEQRRILCVCMFCGVELDNERAGDALESGVEPHELRCASCGDQNNGEAARHIHMLGLTKAAELASDRIERAGVFEEYVQHAREREMHRREENN